MDATHLECAVFNVKSQSPWYLDQLVHPEAGRDTIFAVLKFYMDESGIYKGPEGMVCAVGGFAATNSAWKKFIPKWAQLLRRHKLDEFHSKLFWNRNLEGGLVGEFRGWRFEDCNAFLSAMIGLINGHELFLLGAAVDLNAFYGYPEEQRRYLTGAIWHNKKARFLTTGKPGAPYFVPFHACVSHAIQIAEQKADVAHFVFDEQNEFSRLALQRIPEIRRALEGVGLSAVVGDCVFSSSTQVPALQIADLAAFVCREFYKGQWGYPQSIPEDGPVWGPQYVLSRIQKTGNHQLFSLKKEELDFLVAQLPG
jgi:hypothetical protein